MNKKHKLIGIFLTGILFISSISYKLICFAEEKNENYFNNLALNSMTKDKWLKIRIDGLAKEKINKISWNYFFTANYFHRLNTKEKTIEITQFESSEIKTAPIENNKINNIRGYLLYVLNDSNLSDKDKNILLKQNSFLEDINSNKNINFVGALLIDDNTDPEELLFESKFKIISKKALNLKEINKYFLIENSEFKKYDKNKDVVLNKVEFKSLIKSIK